MPCECSVYLVLMESRNLSKNSKSLSSRSIELQMLSHVANVNFCFCSKEKRISSAHIHEMRYYLLIMETTCSLHSAVQAFQPKNQVKRFQTNLFKENCKNTQHFTFFSDRHLGLRSLPSSICWFQHGRLQTQVFLFVIVPHSLRRWTTQLLSMP